MKDYTPYSDFYLAGIILSDLLLLVLVSLLVFISLKVIWFYVDNQKLSSNMKKASDLILGEN